MLPSCTTPPNYQICQSRRQPTLSRRYGHTSSCVPSATASWTFSNRYLATPPWRLFTYISITEVDSGIMVSEFARLQSIGTILGTNDEITTLTKVKIRKQVLLNLLKGSLYRKIKCQINQESQILSNILLVAVLQRWRMLHQPVVNLTIEEVLQWAERTCPAMETTR